MGLCKFAMNGPIKTIRLGKNTIKEYFKGATIGYRGATAAQNSIKPEEDKEKHQSETVVAEIPKV